MFIRHRREKGFTLVELMMTISIMALILVLGTYNIMGNLPRYRLRAAARSLAANLQYLKIRAVATNRNAWFKADLVNGFYTGFVDMEPVGTLDVPADYLQADMNMPDTFGGAPGFLLPPSVSFGLPDGYTSGDGPDFSAFPSAAVTTADRYLGFRPTGIPVMNFASNITPTVPMVVYLRNVNGDGYAVSVQITGRVRVFRWEGGTWQ